MTTTKGSEIQLKPINFKSEKDFTTECDLLLEILRDTKTDWKKRLDALDSIKRIIVGNASAKFVESFDSFILKSAVPITAQVFFINV